jgi:hypothetical protein
MFVKFFDRIQMKKHKKEEMKKNNNHKQENDLIKHEILLNIVPYRISRIARVRSQCYDCIRLIILNEINVKCRIKMENYWRHFLPL